MKAQVEFRFTAEEAAIALAEALPEEDRHYIGDMALGVDRASVRNATEDGWDHVYVLTATETED